MIGRLIALIAGLTAASAAAAHTTSGDSSGTGWHFPAAATVPLLLSAVLYVGGWWRLAAAREHTKMRGPWPARAAAFIFGWACLAVALLSPLDGLGADLFWVHMVQHETLMLLAAPFLVLGMPLPLFLWSLPPQARARAARLLQAPRWRAAWQWLTRPAMGWSLHAAALWIWHAPVLFEAALRSSAIHDLQHVTFLATALLFWSGLFMARGRSAAAGVLYLFTTAVHSSVLGALITFAGRPWYPSYVAVAPARGYLPLEDQQLGGLIMWVPGSMVYVAFALILLVRWMQVAEGSVRERFE